MLLIYSGEIGNALTFLQMPDVKIVDNALQNIPHALSNRCVSVRNKCYAEAIRNEVVHAQLKLHNFSRYNSVIKVRKYIQNKDSPYVCPWDFVQVVRLKIPSTEHVYLRRHKYQNRRSLTWENYVSFVQVKLKTFARNLQAKNALNIASMPSKVERHALPLRSLSKFSFSA